MYLEYCEILNLFLFEVKKIMVRVQNACNHWVIDAWGRLIGMKEGYESYRVLAECDSSFLSASMTQWFHFFYNIGTFKHLLFNVETMSKQTDVIMQPTGKWIERISQSKHVLL